MTNLTYKDSGVDIAEGNLAVELMKEHVKKTHNVNVLNSIGGFGGLFNLDLKKFHNPVLVSSTDGVGTKLKVAIKSDRHDTVGIDLVAMCVNDILTLGATPLFFLDYIGVGKLNSKKVSEIVKGIAEGCKMSDCALIGGETAEMPDMYEIDDYDLAGFSVGAINEDEIIDGRDIKEGNILIGLPSNGIHSNGYSLVRKIVFEKLKLDVDDYIEELGLKLKDELLKPTKIYTKTILRLLDDIKIKGMVHITGGGFIENIPRILNDNQGVTIDKNSFKILDIFKFLQKNGNISDFEMFKTFNMGIGYICIIDKNDLDKFKSIMNELNEEFYQIGYVDNTGKVNI